MLLESERVRLRPATRDDLSTYTRWYAEPEFRYYMGRGDTVRQAVVAPAANEVNFSAELKDGRLIGLVMIAQVRTVSRTCGLSDVGIGERDWWDKGYGTEIVKLALRYCFRELGMHQVHIVTADFNERARRCYGRIFPHEQRHRDGGWQDGRFWDEIYYDILAEEFDGLEGA